MNGSRIILALLALLVALGLLPIGMGFVIESTYFSVIESVQDDAQGGFAISGEFDQGLWSSSSATKIDWPDGESVVLEQSWVHGPVPLGEMLRGRSPWGWGFAVVETTLNPESGEGFPLAFSSAEQPWLESQVRIGFDRSVQFHFSLAAMEGEDADWELDGVWGEGEISAEADARIRIEVHLGRLSLGAPGQLGWDGATLSLERSLDDQGLTNLGVALDVGVLRWMGQGFEKAGLDLALRHVDPAATQILLTALSELAKSPLPEAEREMARSRLLAEGLPQVLRGSPQVELSRFVLRSSEHTLEFSVRIAVDGSDPTLLANPLFALGLVQAEAQVSASRALVESALDVYLAGQMAQDEAAEGLSQQDLIGMAAFMREAALGSWVAAKRLVVEEDQFTADVEFDGGVLILNGEMLDPTELSNPLSSM